MKKFIIILLISMLMFLASCSTGQVFLEHEKGSKPIDPNAIHQNFTYEVEPYHKIWGTIAWGFMVLVVSMWAWFEFKSDRGHEESDEDKSK